MSSSIVDDGSIELKAAQVVVDVVPRIQKVGDCGCGFCKSICKVTWQWASGSDVQDDDKPYEFFAM